MNVVPIAAAFFWSKVEVGKVDDCWIWKGASRGRGLAYGSFRKENAHRYAYQMHKGPIPDGLLIRHMCGNKKCVNPRHLEPGTAQDNMDDRKRLGEKINGGGSWGSANGMSKLTADDVAYIRSNPDGLKGSELAARFGVSRPTISLIRSGKRWAKAA